MEEEKQRHFSNVWEHLHTWRHEPNSSIQTCEMCGSVMPWTQQDELLEKLIQEIEMQRMIKPA